jgi:hypothetical protein
MRGYRDFCFRGPGLAMSAGVFCIGGGATSGDSRACACADLGSKLLPSALDRSNSAIRHHTNPTRLNTYMAYGIGCAAVWTVILTVTQRRTDSQTRNTIRLVCAGWWLGWMSASIARVVYPPPKKLKPEVYNRVVRASIALMAVGIIRLIRLLMAGSNR